jgi:hypothetical protein
LFIEELKLVVLETKVCCKLPTVTGNGSDYIETSLPLQIPHAKMYPTKLRKAHNKRLKCHKKLKIGIISAGEISTPTLNKTATPVGNPTPENI